MAERYDTGLALVARLGALVAGEAAVLCVAGVHGTWRHPPSFDVRSVTLGDIHLRFARQAWHLVTSTFVLRGRCGTW